VGVTRRCTARWNLLRWALPRKVPPDLGPSAGLGLGDQAHVSCTGYGFGAVGRVELAQDMADVLLTVSRVMNSPGYRLVRCARGEHRQHLQLTGGKRVDQARHRRGSTSPGARHVEFAVERLHQPGQAAERDAPGWGPGSPVTSHATVSRTGGSQHRQLPNEEPAGRIAWVGPARLAASRAYGSLSMRQGTQATCPAGAYSPR
jgi:hypothetical protein